MNKYSVCGNCSYFTQALQTNYGTCSNPKEKVCVVDINNDDCEHFEIRTKKSKNSGYIGCSCQCPNSQDASDREKQIDMVYCYRDGITRHDGAFCPYLNKNRSSVRPRRLCDFCERKKLIDDEYGNYKIGCMKLIPLPAINLTTGEKYDPKRNVEYSMFVYESDDDNGEVGSFQVKFCPYCGRKLNGGD